MSEKNKQEQTLEEAFKKLDELIGQLENRDITLEDSFSRYKEGMELLKVCKDKIETVEKKMLVLNEDGEVNEF